MMDSRPIIVFDQQAAWCPFYVRHIDDAGKVHQTDLEGVETLPEARKAAAELGFPICEFYRIGIVPTPSASTSPEA